jgi:hypothetical protein
VRERDEGDRQLRVELCGQERSKEAADAKAAIAATAPAAMPTSATLSSNALK